MYKILLYQSLGKCKNKNIVEKLHLGANVYFFGENLTKQEFKQKVSCTKIPKVGSISTDKTATQKKPYILCKFNTIDFPLHFCIK